MEASSVGNKSDSSEQVKLPLAMFALERNSKKRLLFDLSTQKIHGVSSSAFPDATFAFENRGWFLMVQDNNPSDSQEQTTASLVHPSSGRRLNLPALRSRERGLFVSYVDSYGAPLVVAFIEIWSFVPTAHTACPGDVYWSVYKHDADPAAGRSRVPEPTCLVDVALSGTQAVCLDLNGEILTFDDTEMAWGRRRAPSAPVPTGSRRDDCFLVAADGGVVLVYRSGTLQENAFEFFKLDMEALEWSLLDDRELDGTSLFLCRGQSFRVKEAGKRKVYTFGRPKHCSGSVESIAETCSNGRGPTTISCFSSTFRHEILKSITNIYAYDLDDGTVEMIIPASVVTETHHWVQPSTFATPAK